MSTITSTTSSSTTVFTNTPRVWEVFENLTTISVDYELTKYFDYGLQTFHALSTVFTIMGSFMCVVLNSLLIHCIFATPEFRNLLFFPIGLQAGMDVVGPGIANIIYAYFSNKNLTK